VGREVASGEGSRSRVAVAVVAKGLPLYELTGVSLSLEDIFLQLTTEDAEHASAAA
jgi:hypothetical protein